METINANIVHLEDLKEGGTLVFFSAPDYEVEEIGVEGLCACIPASMDSVLKALEPILGSDNRTVTFGKVGTEPTYIHRSPDSSIAVIEHGDYSISYLVPTNQYTGLTTELTIAQATLRENQEVYVFDKSSGDFLMGGYVKEVHSNHYEIWNSIDTESYTFKNNVFIPVYR